MLEDHLVLQKLDNSVYQRQCDRTWWGQGSLLGGYVQALILSAMRQEIKDKSKQPLTLNTHFLRPVIEGIVRIEIAIDREGRKLSNIRASLYSNERLAVTATAIFAQKESFHDFCERPLPNYATIGDSELPTPPGVGLHAHSHFGFYPRLGSFQRGQGVANVAGWLLPSWNYVINESLLALVADLWVPAVFHYWPDNIGVVGLEINIQFHSDAERLAKSSGPLFLNLETKQASGGYVDEDGLIWNSAGELLCQYRQMRLILDM